MPTLPPYLGTWDSLVQALLHDPTLGSGRKHLYNTHSEAFHSVGGNGGPSADVSEDRYPHNIPDPSPWRAATALLLGAVGAQVAASGGRAGSSIEKMIDDFCGTPPHPFPWWLLTAAEMGSLGEHMAEGSLRDGVLEAASRLIQKALGATNSVAGSAVGARA